MSNKNKHQQEDSYIEPWEEYGDQGDEQQKQPGMLVTIEDKPGGGAKFKDETGKVIAEVGRDDFLLDNETNSINILTASGADTTQLDDAQRTKAMEQSDLMNRNNPMYRGILEACVYFTIGKGFKWSADDEDPRVQKYLDKWWLANKMDGRDVEIVRKFLRYGEVVVRWFEKDAEKRNAKVPKVRFIPYWRLDNIKTNPEDVEEVVQYDVIQPNAADPENGTPETRPVPVKEVQMLKNTDSECTRGQPYFLTIMQACTWFKDFISNRVTLNRFRTVHVLFKKVKGSPSKVNSVKNAKPNATTKGLGGQYQKRMPKAGTTVTHNEGIEYEFKAPNVEAHDARWDVTAVRQYIAAGGQVPEFLLGDAKEANYASAFVSENPFIRQIEYLQDTLGRFFKAMFARAIEHGIKTGQIPSMSKETVVMESGPIMRRVNKILCACGMKDANEQGDGAKRVPVKTKRTVTIQWPSILHKNQLEEAKTLQIHQVMGVASEETIATKLNYEYEDELRRKEEEEKRAMDRFDAKRDAAIGDEEDEDDDDSGGKGAGNR